MKAFLAAAAAAAVIAIVAGLTMNTLQVNTAETLATQNVRLPQSR